MGGGLWRHGVDIGVIDVCELRTNLSVSDTVNSTSYKVNRTGDHHLVIVTADVLALAV